MSHARGWIWLHLAIAWLPIWILFAALVASAHPDVPRPWALLASLQAIAVAAGLGMLVQRLTDRLPWPHPLHARFVAAHGAAALVYAGAWMLLTEALQTLLHPTASFSLSYLPLGYLVLGIWLYVMVAGVTYATRATERAARAEAIAARSQLSALRAQLNPHFLFNALHTVVQLIPREPRRAAQAAEQVAGLLRTTLEEDRDLVPVGEELAFVERYLDVERIRFGDRLRVRVDIPEEARAALIPSFALQTLVENAVRHGAAPRVEATEIILQGAIGNGVLTLTVRDTGAGAMPAQLDGGQGSGLRRLRERLMVLYGGGARLDIVPGTEQGLTASLAIPRMEAG
jgi:hypothetical protein